MKIENGLVYEDDGRLIGFQQGASSEVVERYLKSVRLTPVVEAFVFDQQQDTAPDGRQFGGHRVGDLKRDHRGHSQVSAPNGVVHSVDLSSFHEDDHVRITWVNEELSSRIPRI